MIKSAMTLMPGEDYRSIESIKDTLIGEIASHRLISGDREIMSTIVTLVKEQISDPEFEASLHHVASKIFKLFPVKMPEPAKGAAH